MTTTTVTETISAVDARHVDINAIDPDPHNRPIILDKAFCDSVAEHGVVAPVTVIGHPDIKGRFQMVAGHRRLAAAKKANHASIPAVVRDDLDDIGRVSLQLIENMQRDDLTPSQEATQLLRAITVGHTVKSLAVAVGRSQKWVKERLTIAELPAVGRKRIDQGTWTIADGIAAAKVNDNPAHFERLTELADWRSIEQEVALILSEATFETNAVALVEAARSKGLAVIEADTPGIHQLEVLGIDPEAHQGDECHAVVLAGRPPSAPRLVGVCTNKANHTKTGASATKLPAKTSRLSDDERAERAAQREATQARADAIATVATGKLAKAEHVELIESSLLRMASADQAKAALRILGVEIPKNNYTPTILQDWAGKKPANKVAAVRAIALVEHDHQAKRAWGGDAKKFHKAWQKWLTTHTGWKPTQWDKDQLK